MFFKDKVTPSVRFASLVGILNDAAFRGNGIITVISKKEFNIYQKGKNQIISFAYYSSPFNSILQVVWKYKYYHNEVVHTVELSEADTLTVSMQCQVGERIVSEMNDVIKKHIEKITPGAINLIEDLLNS